jgi:hypothetical protein
MRERSMQTKPAHQQLVVDIMEIIKKTVPEIDPVEILAVLSVAVGRVVAMQDQRRYSPEAVMAIVSRNIEIGNREVIEALHRSEGSA